jgi:Ni/Co efflux regulator RcnB
MRHRGAHKETIVKHFISAAIALTLLASTAAVAQPGNRQNDDGRFSAQGFNTPNNDRPHWSRGDRLPDQFRQSQHVVSDWRQFGLRIPPRGYHWVSNGNNQYLLIAIRSGTILEIVNQNQLRNSQQWARGDRLSNQYRANRYVVSDWRANRLRQPTRGYHWVHVNDQYLLTAIASGVIAEIAFGNR